MDKKTEALREIFIDVASGHTVTERQEESPGTLTGSGGRHERVASLMAEMRDRYGFTTEFTDEQLAQLASAYFEDETDEGIAAELDADVAAVEQARFDVHLLREADRPDELDLDLVREAIDAGSGVDDLTASFDADLDTLDRAVRVITTEREMVRSNYRYRDEFRALLGDGDLSERLTEASRETGLKDATEGLETTTSF